MTAAVDASDLRLAEAALTIPALLQASKDRNDDVSVASEHALWTIGGVLIATGFPGESRFTRGTLDLRRLAMLSETTHPAIPNIPTVVQSLKSESDSVARVMAAEALGVVGRYPKYFPNWSVQVVPALVEALRDRQPLVRVAALRSLADVGPDDLTAFTDEAVGAVSIIMKDSDYELTTAAGMFLMAIGAARVRSVLPVLLGRLGDPDPKIRAEMALILGNVGGEESRTALRDAATGDVDPFVRQTATDALRVLASRGIRE
jgi:HEAT repeat protein